MSLIDTESEPRTASSDSPRATLSTDSRPIALAAPLSLAAVALLALVVHLRLPLHRAPAVSWLDELPAWRHPYPVLLSFFFAAALAAAAAQFVVPHARPPVRHYAPLTAGALCVACLYELAGSKFGWLEQPFFPGPDEILGALIKDRRLLLQSAWHSLGLLLAGYMAGVSSGLVTGVLIGWFPRVRYWGMPALKIVGPIPATALVPLAMTVFRDSAFGAASLIGLAVWFPVTMLTSSGIANVRLSHLDVARTLGAGRSYLIFRVAIPSAMPNVFVGLFMGLGAAFLTLIAAEVIGVSAGLGWYLKWQQSNGEYAHVYAALAVMATIFSTLMTLLFRVRDRALSWQKGVIKW